MAAEALTDATLPYPPGVPNPAPFCTLEFLPGWNPAGCLQLTIRGGMGCAGSSEADLAPWEDQHTAIWKPLTVRMSWTRAKRPVGVVDPILGRPLNGGECGDLNMSVTNAEGATLMTLDGGWLSAKVGGYIPVETTITDSTGQQIIATHARACVL